MIPELRRQSQLPGQSDLHSEFRVTHNLILLLMMQEATFLAWYFAWRQQL